jgi:hypothetical protein
MKTNKTGSSEQRTWTPVSIGKIMKKIAMFTFVIGCITGTAISAPSSNISATKSVSAAIRTLTATAWCLVNEAPVSNLIKDNHSEDVADFINRKDRILAAMKDTIKKKTVPSVEELESINQWILKLYKTALKSDIFDKHSVEMVLFTGNMTVAQGYIDCALFMAKGNKKYNMD